MVAEAQETRPGEVEHVHRLRKESGKHQADWRQEAREAFEFRDGSQWDSTDVAIMEEQRRPVVVFNRVAPIIDSIVGYELNNRQEIRYFPRTMGDRAANAVYTEAARWVRDMCDAEDEESDAYADCITCGMGWTETRVDYEEEANGQIVIERVPPLQMRWDPDARKANLADATWVMREQWMDLDYVKETWPDKAEDIGPTADSVYDSEWLDTHDASNAWKYEQDQTWNTYDEQAGKVLVIHFQWRERESYYRVGDPESGRVIEMETARFSRLRERLDEMGIPYVKQLRWVYKQQFIGGNTLLEEGSTPVDGHFSFFCITGKRDEEQGWWYGMVRAMRDPQRWANSFFSQAMFSLQANSKGGVIVEDTAVDDRRAFEDRWASPDGVIYVEDGALQGGRIQEKSFGGYPPALDKLMQFSIQSIRDCTGVNLEMLGQAGHEQPGILEVERKKAALVILAPLINSLRRYRKMQGRALLQFMQRYIPQGTIMRIVDRPVPFYRDEEVDDYDVIVDQAPNSPNLKTEVWGVIQNIVPAMVKAGVPLPPDMVKYSPLPDSVADEWSEYIRKRSEGPDPQQLQQQMEQMQEELNKLQEENRQLSDKRQAQEMQLEFKREEAQLDAYIEQQRMLMEARSKEMALMFEMKTSDADRAAKLIDINARYDAELAKIEAQIQMKQTEGGNVVNLDQERDRRDVRETILSYLKSRGGDIAKLAEKLS